MSDRSSVDGADAINCGVDDTATTWAGHGLCGFAPSRMRSVMNPMSPRGDGCGGGGEEEDEEEEDEEEGEENEENEENEEEYLDADADVDEGGEGKAMAWHMSSTSEWAGSKGPRVSASIATLPPAPARICRAKIGGQIGGRQTRSQAMCSACSSLPSTKRAHVGWTRPGQLWRPRSRLLGGRGGEELLVPVPPKLVLCRRTKERHSRSRISTTPFRRPVPRSIRTGIDVGGDAWPCLWCLWPV